MRRVALLLGLVCAACLVAPAACYAATWSEGAAGRAFDLASSSGVVVGGTAADQTLQLPWKVLRTIKPAGTKFDPRSVQMLSNGHILVADGDGVRVVEMTTAGSVAWSYSQGDDPSLSRPFFAQHLDSGNTLITDRATFRVIEVDPAKRIVWHYGESGVAAATPGHLNDPFSAVRLTNGHTLICDNLNANRVIEVDQSGHIVWSYGDNAAGGSGAGELNSPRSAVRIGDPDTGTTLIADEVSRRVLEVDHSGRIVWQYTGDLSTPCYAQRLLNGDTLIVDGKPFSPGAPCNRVIEVDRDKNIVQSYGSGAQMPSGSSALNEPRAAVRLADGTTLVCDEKNSRLLVYGYAGSGQVVSNNLDMERPNIPKRFSAVSWHARIPSGSVLSVAYSIDNGPWQAAAVSGSGASLPRTAVGVSIRYRLGLSPTRGADYAPEVRDVTITWVPPSTSSTDGNGSSGNGSGGSGGSGSGGTGGSGGSGTTKRTKATSAQVTPGARGAQTPVSVAGGSTGSGPVSADANGTVSGFVMSEVDTASSLLGDSGSASGGANDPNETKPGTVASSTQRVTVSIVMLVMLYSSGMASSPLSNLAGHLRPLAAMFADLMTF